MEITIRVVDGRLSVQSTTGDAVAILGVLEMAKASVLARPAGGVQTPPPAVARQLVGG